MNDKQLKEAKQKDQRIAELEEEIELKNHTIEFLESQRDNTYKDYIELKKTIQQTQLDWVDTDKNLELAKNYVKDLQEENEQLKALLNADNKMKTNSLAGFEKLKEENAKLKEQLKNAMKIPDEIMNFIIDCTYVKELDYNNINDYVNKLKAEARKYLEERK